MGDWKYFIFIGFFSNKLRATKNITVYASANVSSTFVNFSNMHAWHCPLLTSAIRASLRSLFFELPIFALIGYYIFSYWDTVSQAAEDSCNLMFWIKGNDAIAARKVEGRATKFFEIPSLTKKLWKFRLRRKIRISGSERQIMPVAIIRWSVRSLGSFLPQWEGDRCIMATR